VSFAFLTESFFIMVDNDVTAGFAVNSGRGGRARREPSISDYHNVLTVRVRGLAIVESVHKFAWETLRMVDEICAKQIPFTKVTGVQDKTVLLRLEIHHGRIAVRCANHRVVEPKHEGVTVFAAIQNVCAVTSHKGIPPGAAVEPVVALAAMRYYAGRVGGVAKQQVVIITSKDCVGAITGSDNVMAPTGLDPVVAVMSPNQIIAAAGFNPVIEIASIDYVIVIGSVNKGAVISAFEHHRIYSL
jgi:hypothetical protein